ncbi:MAG: ATP-binding cassette domain-containing protein [Candidatus Methanoplasma sp.]|jgi:cobalt/nickel transport system ATP-binding protein|nr:ATP-binding cassette domain-containing protein [Candidatus Methanoplasma sp.]
MGQEYVIETQDLCFRYKGSKRMSVDGVNIKIRKGTKTAILGANGAGKSTLFFHFNGIFKPVSGSVLYNGEKIEYSKKALSQLRSDVTVVLQNPDDQIFSATVEEDVAFGPINLNLPRDEVEKRVNDALFCVGMTSYRNVPVSQLSYGQKKRIAFAGALAMKPKVLVLDEPTAGLDPQMSLEIMEIADQLHHTGTTVIISTHDVDLAYSWADEIHVLRRGKLIHSGGQEEFYSDRVNVYLSGLVPPSVYGINDGLGTLRGGPVAPYPRTTSQLLSKIRPEDKRTGTLFLSPVKQGSDLSNAGARGEEVDIGIYGMEARKLAYDAGIRAEYVFNALENCLIECVLGNDAILCFDAELEDSVLGAVERLKEFGAEIHTGKIEL